MNLTIRSIALLGACCVWSGCTEQPTAKQSAAPAAVQPALQRAAGSAEGRSDTPNLATTAPRQPASVADAPLPMHQPEPPAGASNTAPELALELASAEEVARERAAQEAEQKELIDFDREPDPAEVRIDRFVLATGVAAREPVGERDTFAADTKEIYAFVQFANPEGAPYALRVHWEPVDGPASPYGFKFEIPTAARWRTWSWTRVHRAPGHYRAVLRTLKGVEVASREFEIVPN